MAARLGDAGTSHSPLYGFSFDGFPIAGPYQSSGVLADSCWQKRDYSSSSPTGCSDGLRSCLLKDQYDYTKGTTTASSSGPSPSGNTSTQSGNTISAASGIFYQDYFFNTTCSKSGKGMDKFNGHSHSPYGYHYHLTIDSTGALVFPYGPSLNYYGCGTCSNTVCNGTT